MSEQKTSKLSKDYLNSYSTIGLSLMFICALGFFKTIGAGNNDPQPGSISEIYRNTWFILFSSLAMLYVALFFLVNYRRRQLSDPLSR